MNCSGRDVGLQHTDKVANQKKERGELNGQQQEHRQGIGEHGVVEHKEQSIFLGLSKYKSAQWSGQVISSNIEILKRSG
ncbi:hypothetical protein R50072_32540 [Simiduia litorea]